MEGTFDDENGEELSRRHYVETDIYPEKQVELAEQIRQEWTNFTQWASTPGFIRSMDHLSGCMKVSQGG